MKKKVWDSGFVIVIDNNIWIMSRKLEPCCENNQAYESIKYNFATPIDFIDLLRLIKTGSKGKIK